MQCKALAFPLCTLKPPSSSAQSRTMADREDLASDGIPTMRLPSADDSESRSPLDGMQVTNIGRAKRPMSAVNRQNTPAGRAALQQQRGEPVERGRIRPKSALAKSSLRENEVQSDDAVSIASTKFRATSPTASSSRPQTALSVSMSLDEKEENDFNQNAAGESKQWTMRRYFTKGLETPDGRARVMNHFSVYIPPNNALDTPSDYLRVYYCDCLAAKPAKPPFSQDERTVEVERLCEFLLEAAPRSRLDSYPQLLLTKEVLRRFVSKDLRMFSKEKDQLKDKLFLAENELTKVTKKLKSTQTTLEECQEELETLKSASSEAEELKVKLAKAEAKVVELEAKNQELWEKGEEQKSAFNTKLDEVRQSVKAKTEAAMERKLEAFKEIASAASNKAETLAKELADAKQKHAQAMEQLNAVKEQSAIKSSADVLKTLGLLPIEASIEILQSLLADPNIFQQIVHNVSGNADAKVKEVCSKYGILKGDDIVRSAVMKQGGDAKWDTMTAMAAWGATAGTPKCTSLMDTWLLFAVPSPALEAALAQEPKQSAQDDEIAKLQEMNESLTTEKDTLTQENADLRAKAEGLEKELDSVKDKLTDLQNSPAAPPPEPQKQETIAKLLDSEKQPQVLNVYNVNPKQLKGKNVQPHTMQNLLSLFANMYENKAQADIVDDRENNSRQSFPEYIRDFLINRFGLKSIALQNLKGMILGIQKYSDDSDAGKRIKVFGLLSGILLRDCWHEDLSNFVLHALGLIFQVSKIKENMDHAKDRKPTIDPTIAIEASKQGWAKYGFGDMSALEDRIIHLAQQLGGLRLHDWLECIVEAWFEGSKTLDSELRSVFKTYDADGNGVLDMSEFSHMVRQLAGPVEPGEAGETAKETIDDRTIARLFAEALEESSAMAGGADGDLDVMSAEGFIRVARKFHLGGSHHGQ